MNNTTNNQPWNKNPCLNALTSEAEREEEWKRRRIVKDEDAAVEVEKGKKNTTKAQPKTYRVVYVTSTQSEYFVETASENEALELVREYLGTLPDERKEFKNLVEEGRLDRHCGDDDLFVS